MRNGKVDKEEYREGKRKHEKLCKVKQEREREKKQRKYNGN